MPTVILLEVFRWVQGTGKQGRGWNRVGSRCFFL